MNCGTRLSSNCGSSLPQYLLASEHAIVNALDFTDTTGVGTDGYSIVWDNDTQRFVLVEITGITDHGLLTGLEDDDHPQYHNNARGDARYDALGAASLAVSIHVGLSDPHIQYELESANTAAAILVKLLTVDGLGSGLDADLLDGFSSAAFASVSHVHAGEDITSGTVADARIASTITRDSEVVGIAQAAGVFQPIHANLTALAGLIGAADKLPYFTAAGAMAAADFSSVGRNIVASTTQAFARDALGLGTIAIEPESNYLLLGGRASGQTARGDTASGGNLTLMSTIHATKGKILFGTSAYDEANNRLGIGIASPTQALDVVGSAKVSVGLITPKLSPAADSTTAVQIVKADGTTAVVTIDTTNSNITFAGINHSIGLNATPQSNAILQVGSGNVNLPDLTRPSGSAYGIVFTPSFRMTGNGTNHGGMYIAVTSGNDGSPRTVTNQYGLWIDTATKGSSTTVTNAYGLYIVPPTIASTNYALYVLSGNSFFGGNVGIGVIPTQKLDVLGSIKASVGLITPKWSPAADSTTAIQITKADGSTSVVTVDTTNGILIGGMVALTAPLATNIPLTITDAGGQSVPIFRYLRSDALNMVDIGRGAGGLGQVMIYGASSANFAKMTGNSALVIDCGATATFRLLPSGNDIYFQNTVSAGNIYFTGSNSAVLSGNVIFKVTGNVAIGDFVPTQKLDVLGVIKTSVGLITPKIYPAADSTTALQITKADGSTAVMVVNTTGGIVDVIGTIQANGLRLDVTPTAETPSMTHTITVSLNGVNYKIPCVAA